MAPDVLKIGGETGVQGNTILSDSGNAIVNSTRRTLLALALTGGLAVSGSALSANRDTTYDKPIIVGDQVTLVSSPVYERIPANQRQLFTDALGNIQAAASKSKSNIGYVLYTKELSGPPNKSGNVYTGFNSDAIRNGLSNEGATTKVFGLKNITGEDTFSVDNLPAIFSKLMPTNPNNIDVSWMRGFNMEQLPQDVLEYRKQKELEANVTYNNHASKLPIIVRNEIVLIANQVIPMIPQNKQTPGVLARYMRNIVDIAILSTRIDRGQTDKMSPDAILNTGNAIGELIYLTSFGQGIVDRHGYRNPKVGVTGENQTIEFITYKSAQTIPEVGAKIDSVSTIYGKGFGSLVVGTLNQKSDNILALVEARLNEAKIVVGKADIVRLQEQKAELQRRITEGERRITEGERTYNIIDVINEKYYFFDKQFARYKIGEITKLQLKEAYDAVIAYEKDLATLQPVDQVQSRRLILLAKDRFNS